MDQHELAEELYDDYRSDCGDGEYAWGEAWDEAGEIIRRANAHRDACESFDRDLYASIERDNANGSHRPSHQPAGDAAIGLALGAVGAALGYGLYKWLFNEDAEKAPTTTPAEEAHTADMERLIRSTNSDDLVDAVRKDLNSHLEQPGSIFYMSTEFEMPELVGHFRRFKDPQDINLFIRGEERPMVLAMAELRKEELAA